MEQASSTYRDNRFCLVCQKLKMKKYVMYNQEEKKYFELK